MDWNPRILEWVAIFDFKNLPDPGIEPTTSVSPVLAGEFFTTEPPVKPNRGGDQGISSVTRRRSLFPSCPCVFRQKVTSVGGAAAPGTGTCLVGCWPLGLFGHHPMGLPSEMPQNSFPWSFSSKAQTPPTRPDPRSLIEALSHTLHLYCLVNFILAWKISWTEDTRGLQSIGSQTHTHMHY